MCSSGNDDLLDVGIDEKRPTCAGSDHLGDERNARAAPNEHDASEVAECESGAGDNALKGLQGSRDARPQCDFQLIARHAHLGADAGCNDVDGGLAVD